MISPIKTIVSNQCDRMLVIRVNSHLALVVNPKGTAGDTASVSGDIFSMMSTDKESLYVLSMVKAGQLKVTYSVDALFGAASVDNSNMRVPVGELRNWYVAKVATKKEPEKKVEEPKKEADKPAEPAKPAEPPKTAETVKAPEPPKEEPKAAPKQETPVEEPKKEAGKPVEAKEAPKAGRKIKVQ